MGTTQRETTSSESNLWQIQLHAATHEFQLIARTDVRFPKKFCRSRLVGWQKLSSVVNNNNEKDRETKPSDVMPSRVPELTGSLRNGFSGPSCEDTLEESFASGFW